MWAGALPSPCSGLTREGLAKGAPVRSAAAAAGRPRAPGRGRGRGGGGRRQMARGGRSNAPATRLGLRFSPPPRLFCPSEGKPGPPPPHAGAAQGRRRPARPRAAAARGVRVPAANIFCRALFCADSTWQRRARAASHGENRYFSLLPQTIHQEI